MFENEVSEDKRCRLCGFSDINNKNIFTGYGIDLVDKIHTVYPILLYQNDPLPQNICNKCVSTVNVQYNEVTRIIRHQKMWANKVRTQQPGHNFNKIINFIEGASSDCQKSIKFNFDENVSTNMLNRFLLLTDALSPTQKTSENKDVQNSATCSTTDTASEVDDSCFSNSNNVPAPNADDNKSESESMHNEVIASENAKAVLDNSDSKEHVKMIIANLNANLNTNNSQAVELQAGNIKVENTAEEAEENNACVMQTDISNSFACQYCSNSFPTNTALVTHQLKHMRLKLPKIFMKKVLAKPFRRGRVTDGHRNLRCVSCWQIYTDKKAMVNHWGARECEFFCAVCGKEFSENPNILKQHLLKEHGISYRSVKKQRELMKKLEKGLDYDSLMAQSKSKKSKKAKSNNLVSVSNCSEGSELPIKILIARAEAVKPNFLENSDGRVLCEICSHPFKSLKGRNSHMKVHKRRKDSENSAETSQPIDSRRQTENITNIPAKDDPPSKNLQTPNIETNLSVAGKNTANEDNKNWKNGIENPTVIINNEYKKISTPIININPSIDKSDNLKDCRTLIKAVSETKLKSVINTAEHKTLENFNIMKNTKDEEKQKIATAKTISCSAIASSTSPMKDQTCNEITRINCINTKISVIQPPKNPTDNFSQSQFRTCHKLPESRTESLTNNCFPHSNIRSTLTTHSPISGMNFIPSNDNATIVNNNQLYNLLMNTNDNFSSRIAESNLPYNNILYSSLVNNAVNYGHVNDYTNMAHNMPGNSLGNNHLNFGCPNILPSVTNHNLPYHSMVNSNVNFAAPNDIPRLIHNNHPSNALIYSPTNNNVTSFAANLPCDAISNSHVNYSTNSSMGVCATSPQIQRPVIAKKIGIRTKYVEPRDKSRFPKPGEPYYDKAQNNFLQQQYRQQ